MGKKFGDDSLIYSWMRNRNTLEFLGIWEQIHNPDFKGGEFETFKSQLLRPRLVRLWQSNSSIGLREMPCQMLAIQRSNSLAAFAVVA